MLLAEYDYDTDIAVQRKEAFEDGISIGRNEGIAIGEKVGKNAAFLSDCRKVRRKLSLKLRKLY